MNVLLNDPFAFEVFLSHATMGGPDGREHQQFHAGSFCNVGNIFTLPDLAIKTNRWQPVILYAENTIDIPEGGGQFGLVIHIARENLGAQRSEFLCGGFVRIARQRPHLPAVCQKFSGNCTALLSGCTGYRNDFVIHIVHAFLPVIFRIYPKIREEFAF